MLAFPGCLASVEYLDVANLGVLVSAVWEARCCLWPLSKEDLVASPFMQLSSLTAHLLTCRPSVPANSGAALGTRFHSSAFNWRFPPYPPHWHASVFLP